MDILSDTAINIIKDLHTDRLDYETEYVPLIDAAQKLAEYEIEEDQGYIIRLPCKIGDVLYTFIKNRGHDQQSNKIHTVKVNCIFLEGKDKCFDVNYLENDDYMAFDFSDVGKTIFHTREEAEQALKETEK